MVTCRLHSGGRADNVVDLEFLEAFQLSVEVFELTVRLVVPTSRIKVNMAKLSLQAVVACTKTPSVLNVMDDRQ